MSTLISILFLIFLYILVISLSKYGNKFYWFFETAHFLGGFFVAIFFSNFFDSSLFIIFGVLMVGLLWEIWEFMVNKNADLRQFLMRRFNYYVDKVTWPDTILDLFLGFLGAIVYLYII